MGKRSRLKWNSYYILRMGVVACIFTILLTASTYTALLYRGVFLPPHQICLSSQSSICFSHPEILSSKSSTSIAISNDGQVLASSYGKTILLWDLNNNKPIAKLQGHSGWVSAIAFSSDGKTFASSGLDSTIRLWDWNTGKLLQTLAGGRMTDLVFSPDGQILAGGSGNPVWFDGQPGNSGVKFWQVKTGKALPTIGSGKVSSLAFSPDGQMIALGGRETQVWNFPNRQLLRSFNSSDVTTLAFSPQGKTLISGSSKIKVWRVSDGKLLDIFNSGSSDLALSPDGKLLAVTSGGTVELWQMATGKLLGTFRGSWYSNLCVVFGQGGQAIVSSGSDGIRIWRSQELTPRDQAPPHPLQPKPQVEFVRSPKSVAAA